MKECQQQNKMHCHSCEDTTSSPTCPGLSDYVPFNGNSYLFSNASTDYAGAEGLCLKHDGRLIRVMNIETHEFLLNHILTCINQSVSFWIGLEDRLNEAVFVYSDGSTLGSFNRFYGGVDVANEDDSDCVLMATGLIPRWDWWTEDCSKHHRFICEYTRWRCNEMGTWEGTPDVRNCVSSWLPNIHHRSDVASGIMDSTEKTGILFARTVDNKTLSIVMDNIVMDVGTTSGGRSTFPELTNASSDWADVTDGITLPRSQHPVVAVLYNTLGRYLQANPTKRTVNSRVISATLVNRNSSNDVKVAGNVTIYLEHTKKTSNKSSCAFWNFNLRDWSDEGCTANIPDKTHTVCVCNHLTSFAILVDVTGQKHPFALSVITYIGCGISIVCLVFCICAFLGFRRVRCPRTIIHANLCICLLVAEVVFLAAVDKTENKIGCDVIAIILHYLFLAVFTWMCVEGVELYVLLVKVFNLKMNRLLYYHLVGYACANWTEWLDGDDPVGTGDWELLRDLQRDFPGRICSNTSGIQARVRGLHVEASATGERFVVINPQEGFACRNNMQSDCLCQDYEVRFCCKQSGVSSSDPEPPSQDTTRIVQNDIDECSDGTHDCHPNAECHNNGGSFSCQCKQGFIGNGTSCSDVDECTAAAAPCDPKANCTNTEGFFLCLCNTGYMGNGTSCADIDECNEGSDNCHSNATCSNSDGSYSCDCTVGYYGDGTSCWDVNECTTGSDCAENATCTNIEGSFFCLCNHGYTGNGLICTDVLVFRMRTECFRRSVISDIDECAEDTNICHTNATCRNTDGSYSCVCDVGFVGNGTTCTDINECSDGVHNCHPNATCINTAGTFSCECNNGYTGDGTSCSDVDECASETENDCDRHAHCNNTDGSFLCRCNAGYTGNGALCSDISLTYCPRQRRRAIMWPESVGMTVCHRPCPRGSVGIASWTCGSNSAWEGEPDLTGCLSHWLHDLDTDRPSTDVLFLMAEQLENQKHMYGGDVITCTDLFGHMVERHEHELDSVLHEHKEHIVTNFTEERRFEVAPEIMDNTEKSGLLLAKNVPKDTVSITRENIVMDIVAKGSGRPMDFPQRTDERSSILARIPDSITVPGTKHRVVAALYKNLGQYLKPKRAELPGLNDSNLETDRVLSRVISATIVDDGKPVVLNDGTVEIFLEHIQDLFALHVITYIGCIISILCLFICICIFLGFRRVRCSRTVIHANLCICLLFAELVFLVGVDKVNNPVNLGFLVMTLKVIYSQRSHDKQEQAWQGEKFK
uniref:Uncharacterized protein n=1 Tax=Branchiostoma floridae TaxID=7739 RepID=C3XRG9_BRAFL|eukprot:XP_002613278.1 hypothetical protein BRAFLDRAFT_68243 [Branchiostoma floridae]